MWSRYMTPAVGKRLSNQLASFSVAEALGEISLNSAMLFLISCAPVAVPSRRVRQGHHPLLSSPMSKRVSERYMCGGTSRLSGAGLFLKTRPARSKVDPWQGQRKPPCQSSGRDG